MQDCILAIDHEHAHLSALLRDLENALGNWVDASLSDNPGKGPSAHSVLDILTLLKDDTYEHFEREEHGLFPNLRAKFPELSIKLDELQLAHEEICKNLMQLETSLEKSPKNANFEHRAEITASAKHLVSLYWRHTAIEWKVLRDLLGRLDPDNQKVILEQLLEI
jgi:hemerythrin-like domain-containing protein